MKTHAPLLCLGSKIDVRRVALSALAVVVFGFAPAALFAATTINVTVPGTAGPWDAATLNPSFVYTWSHNYTAPITVGPANGFSFGAGSTITVARVSGGVSAGAGFPFLDANGKSDQVSNNFGPNGTNGAFPAFYMNPLVPVYSYALVGTFTNNGVIVGQPFLIGNGPTILTIPSGANQLQLGINDNYYGDNTGSFTVSVTEGSVTPPPRNPAQTFDSVTDYSSTENPNGAWSYGWKTTFGGPLMLYSQARSLLPGLVVREGPDCPGGGVQGFPLVNFNDTGATLNYNGNILETGAISQPADMLSLHPSCIGTFSVVRWTAPTSGWFKVVGQFRGIDVRGTSSDVHILQNSSTSLLAADIAGFNATAPFDLLCHVVSGDTLDFLVGFGTNNTYDFDSTGLAVNISVADSVGPVPTAVAMTPNPTPVDHSVIIAADITDVDTGMSNIQSAEYSIDGGPVTAMSGDFGTSPAITVGAVIPPFTEPGVYSVCVYGTDAAGNVGPEYCVPLAVYDPDGGFVTGGGWIMSPPGAYTPNPAIGGKATFGFVSKYLHGADIPIGDTQFVFHAAGFRFQSTSYDWLVVAGARAKYKGVGSVNGQPGFRFLLSAIDGNLLGGGNQADTLRLKVEDPDGGVIYDNQMGAADGDDPSTGLGGGSIVIHKP